MPKPLFQKGLGDSRKTVVGVDVGQPVQNCFLFKPLQFQDVYEPQVAFLLKSLQTCAKSARADPPGRELAEMEKSTTRQTLRTKQFRDEMASPDALEEGRNCPKPLF